MIKTPPSLSKRLSEQHLPVLKTKGTPQPHNKIQNRVRVALIVGHAFGSSSHVGKAANLCRFLSSRAHVCAQ